MSIMHKNSVLKSDQRGLVAIITTMILMIVISLIVLGFSQSVRRNQRETLDTQLSSQAFYAAESGINIAKKKLASDVNFRSPNCNLAQSAGTRSEYLIDGDNVSITCLIVSSVSDLQFSNVGSEAKTTKILPEGGAAVDTIYINWESDASSVANCSGGSSLPTATSWSCSEPLLRVDLVPLQNNLTQSGLLASQFTGLFYPSTTGGSATLADGMGANKGAIFQAQCSDTVSANKTRRCFMEITGASANQYGMRIQSLYRESRIVSVSVLGNRDLEGAQVQVDATGKAGDVLKRLQARVKLATGETVANYAVDSLNGAGADDQFCKQYKVGATSVARASGASACLTD